MGRGPGRPAKTRGPPHGQGGRRSNSSSSTPRIMGRGPGRPMKTRGPPHWLDGAAHTGPTFHGLRPGPARQFFIAWAAAQPGPSIFYRMGRGPARPGPSHFQFFTARPGIEFSKFSTRPGPAHHNFKFIGPARPGPSAHDKP